MTKIAIQNQDTKMITILSENDIDSEVMYYHLFCRLHRSNYIRNFKSSNFSSKKVTKNIIYQDILIYDQ